VLIAAFASCGADGQWCSDEKVAAIDALKTELDPDARFAAFEELQRLWYEQAPAVKITDQFGVAALASSVQGLLGNMHFEIEPEFANAWLKED
jgi:ABC-type transport system substrate-binding protein